jgi:putative ABC transport system permease protein
VIPGSRIIGLAARLVPARRRRDWRREWEAEAAYAWKCRSRNGQPTRVDALRLRARVSTCVIDALWERKETMKMTGLFDDMRFAVRSLRRYPAFTVIAVLTLALGIGANSAVFTLVDGVLISPLPFDDSERLVSLQHLGREGRDELPVSDGLYILYREQVESVEGIALYRGTAVNLVAGTESRRISAQYVTPTFFDVLGVPPRTGRAFLEEEGRPGAEPVAILSDGLWEEQYGRNPDVVGRTLDVDGVSRRIAGVMPEGFGHPDREARIWLPYAVDPAQAPLAAFGAEGIARLADGASIEALHTELSGLTSRLPERFPESGAAAFLAEVNLRPVVLPLKQAVVGDVSGTLWILLGTVGFVLLIACANVANLLLVRAESRQREMALRVAVGAGRLQVLRSLMAESVVLAAVGGMLGAGIAALAVRMSLSALPAGLPRVAEVGVDSRVLAFTAVIALGCAAFFGFFPLLRYGAGDLAGQLREGGGGGAASHGPRRNGLRNGLVVAQMALALVLLVGSGLMLRSFQALRSVDPGFDPDGVLVARLSVPGAEIEGWEETVAFYRQLRERILAQPGVAAAGFTQGAPLTGGMSYFSIEVEDHPRGPDELPVFARNVNVGPGYLEAMGIRLVEGRTFQEGDGAEGLRATVVSRTFAEMWWPEASPLGRRMRIGYEGEDWYEIVGVVEDVHHLSLEEAPEETIYWPATVGPAESPFPTRSRDIAIKTAGDPLELVPVLRREVRALNPRIPVSNPRAMTTVVSDATSRTSFTAALLGVASGIALLLGLVGIYGVVSYVVSQRTREIGVRMALGATAPSVRSMVVRQGLLLAGVGVAIGLVAAGALSRIMSSILYGVSATDPVTYGSVGVVLVMVALVASWVPARRAAAVDPSRALRME